MRAFSGTIWIAGLGIMLLFLEVVVLGGSILLIDLSLFSPPESWL